MMIPVRNRPRGNEAYPCPKCGRLIDPKDHLCLNCDELRKQRRTELIKKQTEGGRPFFIASGLIALLLVLYLIFLS